MRGGPETLSQQEIILAEQLLRIHHSDWDPKQVEICALSVVSLMATLCDVSSRLSGNPIDKEVSFKAALDRFELETSQPPANWEAIKSS